MKLVNIPNYLDQEVIKYIDVIVEAISESDFDEKMFLSWLVDNDVRNKSNPSAYIKACFKRELEAGTFRPMPKEEVHYLPNTQEFINEMRLRGICILADDSVYAKVLFEYLLNDLEIDSEILRKLNHKILKYMKQGQSFNDYKELLKQSNTLKDHKIDWEYIEKQALKEIKEWNDLLDDIEKYESEE